MAAKNSFEYQPLTPQRWIDFEEVMGRHGAYGGCWCMFWHLTRADFAKAVGENNKSAMLAKVKSGETPGILIYVNQQPVAWCAVAPRSEFAGLERSRVFKRVDQAPVWSIVCFYIRPEARAQGFLFKTIQLAVQYAGENGAKIVEAYPVEQEDHCSPANIYMGVAGIFRKAGFKDVQHPPASRHVIMRIFL